jgi:hypothetical protein
VQYGLNTTPSCSGLTKTLAGPAGRRLWKLLRWIEIVGERNPSGQDPFASTSCGTRKVVVVGILEQKRFQVNVYFYRNPRTRSYPFLIDDEIKSFTSYEHA